MAKVNDPLSEKIIGEAMYVHRILGHGFPESIYHNALLRRFQKLSLPVQSQANLPVYFEDEMIGNFLADFILDNRVIIEIKAVSALISAHEIQLVNYLCATRLDSGLLINFGAPSLQFKRKFRNPPTPAVSQAIDLHASYPVNP